MFPCATCRAKLAKMFRAGVMRIGNACAQRGTEVRPPSQKWTDLRPEQQFGRLAVRCLGQRFRGITDHVGARRVEANTKLRRKTECEIGPFEILHAVVEELGGNGR